MLIRLVIVIALVCSTALAFGSATGLNIIPTAEVLAPRMLDMDASIGTSSVEPRSALEFQFGLPRNSEFGYDFWGNRALQMQGGNFKKGLLISHGQNVLALGMQNIGHGLQAEPYSVGRLPVGRGWCHLGLIEIERVVEPMLGYDCQLNKKMRLLADYTGGSQNASSAGVNIDIGPAFVLDLVFVRQNSGPNKNGFFIEVDYEFTIGGKKEKLLEDHSLLVTPCFSPSFRSQLLPVCSSVTNWP